MKTIKQLREALEIGTDEIVDAYKKATPGEAVEPEDQGEYDNEGQMAKTQLRGILADAGHMVEMFEDEQNLPEWVQNKITKAADYLNSAHRYMMNKGDTNESLDEAKFTDKQIKMAYGVLNDPRWKGGNMTAIVKKLEQIAKGLSKHPGVQKALKATNEDLEEKYRPPTQAEIDADKKKDRKAQRAAGKKRPSMSTKSIGKKMYGNMRGGLKEDEVNEMGPRHTSKPMKNRFGGAVDAKKFDVYKKFVKQNNVDEPTVRMVIDNPNDAESKRMMKNKNIAKAVDLRKAAMKEEVDERKLTPKEIKKALASAKAKAKPKSKVSLKKAPFEIPESLAEKLEVSDGMAKWIEDFQASDAPQFKGKDKNERREMAIAAYLAAKRRGKKED